MKLIFTFFLILLVSIYSNLSFANINNNIEDESEDYLSEDVQDFNFTTFKEEMNYLENKTSELNNYLDDKNTDEIKVESKNSEKLDSNKDSDTDEVTLTHSAVKREPAVVDDDDLKAMLDSNNEPKKRRVRAR